MSRRLIASSLVVSFLLAGCGAQKAALVSAPVTKAPVIAAGKLVSNNTARAAAPTVGVIRGQAPVPSAPHLFSEVRVLGVGAMAQEEMTEDADNAGLFSLFSQGGNISKPFSKTGVIRRTEAGFSLETSKGLLNKKKDTTFVLIAGTTAITSQLNERVDAKALVKGTVDKDNKVTVTSVKGLASWGWLTNWFSKGKIAGTVTDSSNDKPLEGVKVNAKSEDGFVFNVTTDADGEFEIKSLTPGTYHLTLSKDGYQTVKTEEPETVEKRQKAEYVAKLAPIPAPAPAN